jgi:hypothetical protein
MKYLIILSAILIFSFSTSAQPSIWEITTGTTFEVQTNADFCVDSIRNLGGTLIFNGTRCGNPVSIIGITEEIPREFRLYGNYPNPFNPVTTLKFDIPKLSYVKITVYDILGREVSKPVEQLLEAGRYMLNIDASGLSSGTYFYRIEATDPSAGSAQVFRDVRKMVVVR